MANRSLSADEAETLAREAYTYLYPLVLMDTTRRQATNVAAGQAVGRGPANEFVHVRTFPPADFRDVVRPNFDTLYSIAWLDLTKGPMIVSVPDTAGRYYLLPMLDLWTDVFASPGKRTTGTGAENFAVVPPGWSGTLPDNVERINAPTPYVWVIGRTQTNGTADYAAVNKIQDGMSITRLADWGRQPSPSSFQTDSSIDMTTPPMLQVEQMSAGAFFARATEILATNPPHIVDQPILARISRLGIIPGKSFDISSLSTEIAKAVEEGAKAGLPAIKEKIPTLARVVNGWQLNTDTMGVYGTYYIKRAGVALIGLGANLPEDAVYPLNLSDSDGKPLDGANAYVLHFTREELPPVDAFWSVTLYDPQGFPYANALNRCAIGDRDRLQYNADGSLDLYIQHDNPGAPKESNWLPAPAGPFNLTMRLYAPRSSVTDGAWAPPPVKRTDR
ncbi:MAG: DUF1254 domain-containing protein [Candidatus Cybelea sp.]